MLKFGSVVDKKKILSYKEIRVAKCLISGMSAKKISKHLDISLRTVEYYQKKIKSKLSCENTYQTGYKIGIFLIDEYGMCQERTNHRLLEIGMGCIL